MCCNKLDQELEAFLPKRNLRLHMQQWEVTFKEAGIFVIET